MSFTDPIYPIYIWSFLEFCIFEKCSFNFLLNILTDPKRQVVVVFSMYEVIFIVFQKFLGENTMFPALFASKVNPL